MPNPRTLTTLCISLAAVALVAGCGDGQGSTGSATADPTVVEQCTVIFRYEADVLVDAADVWAEYGGVTGSFGGNGGALRCRHRTPGVTGSYMQNQCDDVCAQGEQRRFLLRFLLGQSTDANIVQGPVDLFECLFEGNPASLSELNMSGSIVGHGLDPLPFEALQMNVSCGGWPASTSTSTTTSTVPSGCEGDSCGDVYRVDFILDDAITFGALQWEARFADDVGQFLPLGDGTPVQCEIDGSINGLFATSQLPLPLCDDCERQLNVGIVAIGGATGPHRVISCWFEADESPAPSDFAVTVVDASDLSFNVFQPAPVISVQIIGPSE